MCTVTVHTFFRLHNLAFNASDFGLPWHRDLFVCMNMKNIQNPRYKCSYFIYLTGTSVVTTAETKHFPKMITFVL